MPTRSDPNVDYVMLGCPHAALEQLRKPRGCSTARRSSANCALWIFTSRAVKSQAREDGYHVKALSDAGARAADRHLLGLCAGGAAGHEGRGARLAKQAHYLPAILGVQAWFGSTRDCINAA